MAKKKEEKAQSILFSLIELYLETGKPIGSNTLKDNGLDSVSSATIRNYFVKLEEEGYLLQQHASGGRVPTTKALREYAHSCFGAYDVCDKDLSFLKDTLDTETKEIAVYLQRGADLLSTLTGCATLISFPRFDQDLVSDVKLLGIDDKRTLCIVITQFGLIDTEILYTPKKLSSFSLKRIESYFHFRMTGLDKPELDQDELHIAEHLYNEVLLRHIVGYTNFSSADVYKTGFSKLLNYPECQDASILSHALSLFENDDASHHMLTEAMRRDDLSLWVGEDPSESCSVIALPYSIHGKVVGAVALLGPTRIPYAKIFGLMRLFGAMISDGLARSMETFKITYRAPRREQVDFYKDHPSYNVPLLLEEKHD